MSVSDSCKSVAHLLGAHVDGQLDAVTTIEVEEHLASCETCTERLALDRALRASLKKAVKTAAPDDVRARMLAAMAGQTARAERAENESPRVEDGKGMLRHWRTMLPLASAAALALAWGHASKQPVVGSSDVMVHASLGNDDLLRDLVGTHSRAYPPEQRDPSELSRYVGVPVHVPHFHNAKYLGPRLVTVHGGEAAVMLQYEIEPAGMPVRNAAMGVDHGQRLTLFVYNPRNVKVGERLAPRSIGTAQIRAGQADGYSVAVTTSPDGVGYAVASDLDTEQNAKLAAVVDGESP